jgi:predicted DNA-binding transcriptional regulator AlpA
MRQTILPTIPGVGARGFDPARKSHPMEGSITMMNEQQASEMLGLSVRTLQAWRIRGEGPQFRKLGRRVGYTMGDLKSWVDGNIFNSTTEVDLASKGQ